MGQILFILITLAAGALAYKQYSRIYKNINLGKDEKIEGNTPARLKNMLLVAFGQKKMFKRIVPAILHLFIYVAFLFTQIELVEILVDGIFGVHRFFAPYLGWFYSLIMSSIEMLSFLALIATFAFLYRRNVLKLPRFWKPEMKNWPFLDANIILFLELILVFAIFMMNGADALLQERDALAHAANPMHHHIHYPEFFTPISKFMGPLVFGWMDTPIVKIFERMGWWLHYLVVLGFLNYLPISKHLHILLAFPNTYFSKLQSRGEMDNMPEIMDEVKSMMGLIPEDEMPEMSEDIPEFGANDITGLSWKTILDAYTCTECGRCTSECPANKTGKKLSPRKVMMDIRDRATTIGANIEKNDLQFLSDEAKAAGETKLTKDNYDDGLSLFDFISREEIHACTTCNACVEACPVMINPVAPILEMRRYEILTESAGPEEWVPMFTSLENGGSVWQIPDSRAKWAEDLDQ